MGCNLCLQCISFPLITLSYVLFYVDRMQRAGFQVIWAFIINMEATALDLELGLIWNLVSFYYQIMAVPKPVLKLCGRGIPPSDPIKKHI